MRFLPAIALVAAAACVGPGSGSHSGDTHAAVTIFAAASLKTALDDVAAHVLKPAGHTVRLAYAGTPALVRQIEAGAPADVFISADQQWMDYLQDAGLVDPGSRITLAGNALVLVVPADAADTPRLTANDLDVLLASGRLAIADPATVPAGRYARQALEHLGLWDGVRDRLAPHEHVRAVLALVVRGEVPAGIVYASDAAGEPRVRVAERIPAGSHASIGYPAALLTGASGRARDVLHRLASAEARAIFLRHGFAAPPDDAS